MCRIESYSCDLFVCEIYIYIFMIMKNLYIQYTYVSWILGKLTCGRYSNQIRSTDVHGSHHRGPFGSFWQVSYAEVKATTLAVMAKDIALGREEELSTWNQVRD